MMLSRFRRLTVFHRLVICAILAGLGYIMISCLALSDNPLYRTWWGKSFQLLASVAAVVNCFGFIALFKKDLQPFQLAPVLLTTMFLMWWWTADQNWGPLESAFRFLGFFSSAVSLIALVAIIWFEDGLIKLIRYANHRKFGR